ncbi:hypothetical protein ACIA74_09635 [Streptomyces sp. NPDC051658]|uniref:hypothetical protein n=1 Tax=Streptomyces sp. NPDC051658 TaxID=3365667 RepID=UPI0037991A19
MSTHLRTRARAGESSAFADWANAVSRCGGGGTDGVVKRGTVTFTSAIMKGAVVDDNEQMPGATG